MECDLRLNALNDADRPINAISYCPLNFWRSARQGGINNEKDTGKPEQEINGDNSGLRDLVVTQSMAVRIRRAGVQYRPARPVLTCIKRSSQPICTKPMDSGHSQKASTYLRVRLRFFQAPEPHGFGTSHPG